ncbi:MAG: class I SAM-dependent methyltransferase [Gemmatimonadales bacterium]
MNEQHHRVAKVFDDWARTGKANSMASSHTPFALQALEQLPLSPQSNYLDIGCGNGYTVRWAAERVPHGRAVGIDIAEEMIALARSLAVNLPNAEFRRATFPEHDLTPSSFDAIFSMEVLYYLPDVTAAVAAVGELLREGGHFSCAVDFYRENPASHSWPDDLGVNMHLHSEEEWRELLTGSGLTFVDQYRARMHPAQDTPDWKVAEGSLVTVVKLD